MPNSPQRPSGLSRQGHRLAQQLHARDQHDIPAPRSVWGRVRHARVPPRPPGEWLFASADRWGARLGMRGDHSVLLLVSGCGPQRPGGGVGLGIHGIASVHLAAGGGGRWRAEGLRPSVWGEGASAARWQGAGGLTKIYSWGAKVGRGQVGGLGQGRVEGRGTGAASRGRLSLLGVRGL